MVAFTDETTTDLRKLIETDFGPVLSDEHLWREALYDWLHYRARLIPRQPRQVVFSDNAKANLPSHPAIRDIAAILRIGGDVSPWLSDRVRRRKKDAKADLMFNDWQISHFHLGRLYEHPHKIKRSSPLLFVYINPTKAVILDVQPHKSWGMQALLHTLLRTSPADMGPELDGIRGESITDEQLLTLRAKGMNALIDIDGRAFYSPGMGITSNGAAGRIVRLGDLIWAMLKETRERLTRNNLPTVQMSKIAGSIGLPVRLGVRFDGSMFYAHEKSRRLDLFHSPPLA